MFPVVPYDTDEDHNKKDQSSYKKRTLCHSIARACVFSFSLDFVSERRSGDLGSEITFEVVRAEGF